MHELTERQREILRFIARTTEERGFPPTIREIGGEFDISSTNGVNDHLKALERKGYLSRGGQKSRALVPTVCGRKLLNIEPPAANRTVEVPILGRVAAGLPLLAQENLEDTLQIDRTVFSPGGQNIFALKIKGESMIDDGIFDGDLVFVRPQSHAQKGEIVVALIENEATVKRYFPEENRIRLQPSNPTMQPIFVTRDSATAISVVGVVVGVFRKISH